MQHVVIVREPFASAIAGGRKRVEARLSQARQVPFGVVAPGDVLWFRRAGGGYVARALVRRVTSRSGLTPRGVGALRRRFARRVGAGDEFWSARSQAKYATLVEFERVEPTAQGPIVRKRAGDRRAWLVLGDSPVGGAVSMDPDSSAAV